MNRNIRPRSRHHLVLAVRYGVDLPLRRFASGIRSDVQCRRLLEPYRNLPRFMRCSPAGARVLDRGTWASPSSRTPRTLVDYDLVYAGVLVNLIAKRAGHVFGLDAVAERISLVQHHPRCVPWSPDGPASRAGGSLGHPRGGGKSTLHLNQQGRREVIPEPMKPAPSS